MRYFFLTFALIVVLVISFFGFRGQMFSGTPLRMFPDMDDQDKIKTQTASAFFADGMSARQPVAGTVPRGFEPDGSGHSFGNSTSYLHTGELDGSYGDGMPEELGLNDDNLDAFLRHGEERYKVSCMPCHGESGNGKGTVAVIGIPATRNLADFPRSEYPDGKMFHTITHGQGLMSGYGYNIPVEDRWAIVAYVRALQAARQVSVEQ
ncbi:cytochrome c [Verrucomicrobiaceae bacterium R5-34]|uniref:Cytochrome c n=1 Tax=Oceaniferula flava TaxID=2800421 RepID=A0AAE2SAQ5_9BACT|nr:cytochrome c [Oceaniferula flavus]MBK1831706.1 cytochrome c [Verrucomicrobiaceae bacterium R5-34]MBK1853957.1 cytochrome c [Oceaniferula flavus]MBM1135263.1 cytochrome c [Oceaniferula flavus]